MEALEAGKENVLEAYRNADVKGKQILEKVFGKEIFSTPTDWIEQWKNFCKENNLTVTLPYSDPEDKEQQAINAYVMLRHIIQIRNKGWKPDWDNSNEYKYYPYFDMRSGFGFSDTRYVYWRTSTIVGSRLCFLSAELAESTAKEFISIYEKFIKQ